MDVVMDFIINNYVWILVVIMILLLAIIGSFADKTNFGEGKKAIKEPSKKEPEIDMTNIRMDDLFSKDENKNNVKNPESNTEKETETVNVSNSNTVSAEGEESVTSKSNNESSLETKPNVESHSNIMKSLEQKLSALDKEINTVLPESDVISDNILGDLDDLSLDKKDKKSTKKIDKLKTDDLELPKIKSFNKENDDVWK